MRLFTELIMKIITLIISAGEIIADSNIQNRVHRKIAYCGMSEGCGNRPFSSSVIIVWN